MKRRGVVGALAALIAGGRQQVPIAFSPGDTGAARMMAGQVGGSLAGESMTAVAPGSPSGDLSVFRRAMKPYWRQQQRVSTVTALLGGLPPHVASCHSWAPWYRAQKAAAWAQQQADEHDLAERAIRKIANLLGDDDA